MRYGNWIKTDTGCWLNMDCMTEFRICEAQWDGRYEIITWTLKDKNVRIFEQRFLTREEAQEFLDNAMRPT